MNWTFVMAIWGSILSTILAVLKILEHRKDRVNVKVTVMGNYRVVPETTAYGNRPLVMITAANRGRRPVTLAGAALRLPQKGSYVICADSLTATRPIELTEGKSHRYLMFEDDVKNKYGVTPKEYVACVWDATETYYWSHNIFRRLLKLRRIKRATPG